MFSKKTDPTKGDDDAKRIAEALQASHADSDLTAAVTSSTAEIEVPQALKDPVDEEELQYRHFDDQPFWQRFPSYSTVSRDEFLDYSYQTKNTVTSLAQLNDVLAGVVGEEFIADVNEGMHIAPMNLRLSPYVLSLIDWDDPYNDPLRIQFIPTASTRIADHPMLTLDSLNEQGDSPTPGLVHRYPGKALFLAIDVCPVYCRFCTRSYAIGGDTDTVCKTRYTSDAKRWESAFAYLRSRPDVEDVVVSGGDTYFLTPGHLHELGETLLSIPHVRRIRFATKGPAVMPMKILSDTAWTDALTEIVEAGRRRHKEVCLHTHFNHPNEITSVTRDAMNLLFRRGITVRNQTVLIRNVNDDSETMINLVRTLSHINVQPYYVYQHDMVSGTEEFRTRVLDAVELEIQVRGAVAGYNTPTFVNDVPGGGGKRDVHSYDYYDEISGVSVYRSPVVDEEAVFLYFDPIHLLSDEGQKLWADESRHEAIIEKTLKDAGLEGARRV